MDISQGSIAHCQPGRRSPKDLQEFRKLERAMNVAPGTYTSADILTEKQPTRPAKLQDEPGIYQRQSIARLVATVEPLPDSVIESLINAIELIRDTYKKTASPA